MPLLAPTDGDGPPVTPTQVKALSDAVAEIVASARSYLNLDSGSGKANDTASLTYQYQASVAVRLNANWTILDSFVLNNVYLELAVDGCSSPTTAMNLGAYVEATCTIADIVFIVSGDLPDLQSDQETDFTFNLRVANLLDGVGASDFLAAFPVAPSYASLTASLDADVSTKLNTGDASCVSEATLVMHRSPDKSFHLKQVSFAFRAGFDWALNDDITVRNVSMTASAVRPTSTADWQCELGIQGTVVMGETTVTATALVSLKDASKLTLGLSVGATQVVTGPQLIDFFVPGASAKTTSLVQNALPPSMTAYEGFLQSVKHPLSATVIFKKDAQPTAYWQLSSVDVKIFLSGILWKSPANDDNDALQLTIGDLFFSLQAQLVTKETLLLPPVHNTARMNSERGGTLITTRSSRVTTTYDYKGEIGGTLTLFGGQFQLAVQIKHDSTTSLTTFAATLPDAIYGPLNLLAADSAFNPALAAPADLLSTADANPAPASSPLSLQSVAAPLDGKARGLWITPSAVQLTRAVFKAHFSPTWSLTTSITLTNLGVLFDISNPQTVATRTTSGYVYGQFQTNSALQLMAFVAGTATPKASKFWVGISANTANPLPGDSLQVAPAAVLQDPAFTGKAVPTDGWGLPPFPLDVSTDVLSSSSAYLLIELVQTSDTKGTKLSAVKARALGMGTWNVYGSVQATAVSLDILIETDGATTDFVGHAEIGGSFSTTASNNMVYTVSLLGYVARSPAAPLSYSLTFSIAATSSGTAPPPTTIATLAPFGGKAIDQSQLSNKLPDGYPITPGALTSTSSDQLVCMLHLNKSSSSIASYTLRRMTFRLVQQSLQWSIIKNSPLVVLTYASLDLNIDNPATTPTYGLVAYGLVSIENSANFEAGVQLLTALDDPQKAGWCRVAVQVAAGGAQGQGKSLLNSLVGAASTFSLPQSWPLDPATSSARFALDIYFRKDSQGNWKLTQVDFNLYAGTAADQWVVGQTGHQLTVARLWLSASFTMIDVPGSMTTSVSFNGVAVVSGAAFGITAQLAGSAVHITIAGAQDLQKLVGVFVDGGLDNSALKAPNFASNTSLDAYKTGTFAKATLAFRQQNNTYALDTITAIVETDQEWAIVQGILSMTKLKLTLTLQSMPSSSWLFNATLYSDIRYRKQDGSYDDSVTVDLAATLDYMTLTVRLNCSIFDIFYIATAGRWTLDIDFFPSIKSLYFSMNWKTGRAHFTGQTNDWNLFDDYPNIASIQQPTLTVDISRASSRLDASGVVSGDAVVAGIHIPVSYGLPDGPLKIFGYDIDQIYKMCKKLYELFKDLVTICEIMLDIVGAGEALAVGTALVAITRSVSQVWKAIKKVFGYGDDDDDDDNDGNGGDKTDDNTDRNSVSKPGAYSWVFGGPGLSNGIASEEVNVTVFPKDRLGRTLPIDSTQLTVTIVQNGVILSTINTFTGISRGGYVVSYVRPATLGDYTIHVSYPVALPGLPAGYSHDATVMVTNMAAVLSAENSILDVSENLLAGVMNYATIWPRDNFNNPRLGYDESESFSVEFTPPLEHVSFVLYNDCVKVAFVLPPQVGASYTIRATLLNEGGPQLSGSPAMFTSIRVVGLNRCIAGGPGLCSGLAGADTSFDVFLNDQMGQAWVGDMACTASYTAADGTTVNLVALQAGNQYHFTYTRPATTGAYILKIFVNGELLPAYPIQLQATAAVVNLSVANSFVSLSAGPYYQTSNIVATITAYDNLSEPGLWRATSIAAAFRITTTLESSGTPTSWPLSDRGDGTCFATLSLPDLGQYQVNATSADGTVIVGQGPVTVNVTVPPYIADARCFGPGLSLPPASKPATTYFDVVPLDQYGKMFAMSAMDTTSFLVFMKDEAQVTITPHGRGRRVTYAIPTASPLQANDLVRVLLNDADISGSPYALTSTSPTVPANCRVSQWLSHQVDEISSFIITAVDATGNARRVGGDQVKITSADSGPDWPFVVLNIRDRRDGTYLVRYIPNAVAMKINVLVNNLAIHGSPFSLPANVITFTASEAGIETSSLGVQSEFVLSAKNAQGLPVDISGFLIAAMIYPKSTTVLTAVPVTFKPTSPPAMATVQGTYTIASTMPTGDYALRILVDCAAVVIGSPFTVSVNDAPPATPVATAVGISDVYFATSDLGTFAGSFLVLTDPPTPVSATDLVVVNAGSPGLPIELLPAFRVTVDPTQIGVFNVLTAFRIEGSWPVTITYRGAKVLPPPNVGSQYVFSSCDAAKALAVYVPNQPPPSFAIQEQASVQVQVAAAGNSIKFVKDPKQAVGYQYASAGWSLPALDMGVEMIYHFRIRWNVLAQASEVQMLLPGITQFSRHEMVILRYFQGSTFWTTMDYSKDNAYTNVTQSTVKADGAWHFVCVHLSPTAMRIYEDGHLVVATDRRPLTNMAAFTIGFQVFDDAAAFDADVAECVTCPGTLHTDFSALSRRVEVLFNQSSQQINTQWYQIRQNTAIPVNYTSQGSLQFATSSLSIQNYTAISGLMAGLGPYCAIQYRFRINKSEGYETKVTLCANITMRVVGGAPQWQLPTPWDWIPLSNKTAFRVGSGDYVTVSIIVSPTELVLFENGVMNFEYTGGGGGSTNGAQFTVQHYDGGTGVDVELSHVRVISGLPWP